MVQIFPLTIQNDDFSPKELTLTQADEIEIFITGFYPQNTSYTILTEEQSFTISPGDKLRHKFLTPGDHFIKCKEHTWMTAKVFIVQNPNQPVNSLTASQVISPEKPKKQKNSSKGKRKSEKLFLNRLKNSDEYLDEIFNLVLEVEKIVRDNGEIVDKGLVDERFRACKIKVPEKFRMALEKFVEESDVKKMAEEMTKVEIIEKALKESVRAEKKTVFLSNLCVEKVELMLEDRWKNSCKL